MTMDWAFCIFLYLFCAFQSVLMFNIDPVTWKFFTRNNDVGFGYRVIQRDTSSLLVSDPFITDNFIVVQFHRKLACRCQLMDTQSSNSVVCGPTIPKDCKIITTLNGMCFNISGNNSECTYTKCFGSCPLEIDIAFLMDGSESVDDPDFIKMKTFVITIIQSFFQMQFSVCCCTVLHWL
ncbi:integrin alpha-M-like [Pimephales promelas]|uniref:integrin alpha-M-like n=1 Tax=Pimephales promelas TaxID=90988 RepID=UPI0019558240|nr:integrin alpha-M-like [Pimephales promelas]